ncbi:MAG: hypothetical protein ACFE85_19150 [Candidatus Hodarchaeota archaeon]
MCNSCNCDSFDRCSIVGYSNSPGFCCSMCVGYNEELTCLKAKFTMKDIIPEKVIKSAEKSLIIPNE